MHSDTDSPSCSTLQDRETISPTVLKAIAEYGVAPRKEKVLTAWYATCMNSPHAAVFFRSTRDSSIYRVTVSDLVARAYEELVERPDVEIIAPSLVLKVREHASSMHAILPGSRHLPPPANGCEFRAGLEALKFMKVPVTAPTSNSGNPAARALTLVLARRFADAFIQIPVEYIHYLVTMGWPKRSLSASRRVLPLTVTTALKLESEDKLRLEKVAQSSAVHAMQVANRPERSHSLTQSEQISIERLEDELSRMKRGLRRFVNDAARIRAIQEIVDSFDDPRLTDDIDLYVQHLSINFTSGAS